MPNPIITMPVLIALILCVVVDLYGHYRPTGTDRRSWPL